MEIKRGIYEHFRGKRYEVLDVARHSETLEPMVIYKALYKGEFPEGSLWVRPLTMFQENVSSDGKLVPRFRFVGYVSPKTAFGTGSGRGRGTGSGRSSLI